MFLPLRKTSYDSEKALNISRRELPLWRVKSSGVSPSEMIQLLCSFLSLQYVFPSGWEMCLWNYICKNRLSDHQHTQEYFNQGVSDCPNVFIRVTSGRPSLGFGSVSVFLFLILLSVQYLKVHGIIVKPLLPLEGLRRKITRSLRNKNVHPEKKRGI